jgi:hypothetical protein
MDKYDIPDERKVFLLRQQLEGWKNKIFVSEMNLRVARRTLNDRQADAAKKDIEEAMKAVDFFEEELNKFPQEILNGEANITDSPG